MEVDRIRAFVHDLRQPLGIISANIELVMEGLAPTEMVGALSDCQESGRRLCLLAEALLQELESEITVEVCPHGERVQKTQGVTPACGCCGVASISTICEDCRRPLSP